MPAALADGAWMAVAGALLLAIGLGPALHLVTGRERRPEALALAPVLGLCAVGFTLHPLVLAGLPLSRCARPATALLLLASALLLVLDRRRGPPGSTPAARRDAALALTGAALLLAVLAWPLRRDDLDHRLWQGNSWDATAYIFIATYLQDLPLDLVADPARHQEVVQHDTASALAIQQVRSARLATSITLAWLAETLGRPAFESYLPFKLLNLVLAFPAAVAAGRRLGLGRTARFALAVSGAAGFWALHTVDVDAASQANSLPLCFLFVFAWLQAEGNESGRLFGRERALLAVALAGLFCFYAELVPLLALALALERLLALRGRSLAAPGAWRRLGRATAAHGATAAFAGIVVAPSLLAHLDYLRRAASAAFTRPRPGWEQAFYPFLFAGKRPSLTALWGLPLWSAAGPAGHAAAPLLALALSGVALAALGRALLGRGGAPARLVAAMLLAFWGGGALLWLRGELWLAGKAVAYGVPFAAASVLLAATSGSGLPGLAAVLVAAAWTMTQAAGLPLRLAAARPGAPPLPGYVPLRTEGIDEVVRIGALGREDLAVNFTDAPDPLRRAWNLVLSRQPGFLPLAGVPRFQHGPSIWWKESDHVPRWLLVARGAPAPGRLLAATEHLALYALEPDDVDRALEKGDALGPDATRVLSRQFDCAPEAGPSCTLPAGTSALHFLASGRRPLRLLLSIVPLHAGRWRVLANGRPALDVPLAEPAPRALAVDVPVRAGTNTVSFSQHGGVRVDSLRFEARP